MAKTVLIFLLMFPAALFAQASNMVERQAFRSLSAQQSSSTTVAAQITGLSLDVPQGATISFRLDLYTSMPNPATGIVIGMTSSVPPQVYASAISCQSDGVGQTGASVTSSDIAATISLNGATTSAHCVITGTITGSATSASTLTPTLARASGVGTVTVIANSTIKMDRIR